MANILIVDDDAELLETVAELIRTEGHAVRVARNGEEGIAAFAEQIPDLLVLDIEMPLLDGPGMANQLFIQDAGKEKVPILLVSGFVDLHRIAARVGTPYFLAKPCRLDDLFRLLRIALAERRPPAPSSWRDGELGGCLA